MRTKSKPSERDQRIWDKEQTKRKGLGKLRKRRKGANRSKKMGEFENRGLIVRKRFEYLRMSKMLEADSTIPEQATNQAKETAEYENKEQTAQQRLGNLRTRSKPLESDWSISEQGANQAKETR